MAVRENWGSKIGFILAATGSAVGLGNLWKFPYITWHNNGGAFVIIYLISVVIIGWPIMMAEILLGRNTSESPVPAFEKAGGKGWSITGWLGVFTGFVILGYYSVIAGWTITSFISCIKWSFAGYVAPPSEAFGNFISNGPLQILLAFLFIAATAVIIWRGIKNGIERTTKILMPILFVILVYLVIMVQFLSGRNEAYTFLFTPNFAQLPWEGVLEAVGHAFFTLSLGMGVMITYGSYMRKEESIAGNAALVVFLDTFVAICACIIMYTIIFTAPTAMESVGKSTVGMLFNTLPVLLYTEIPFGSTIAPIFYILVAFAALSSTISLLEVIVSLFIDKLGMPRHKATFIGAGASFGVAIICALSLGSVSFLSDFNFFGPNKDGVLNTLDHIAANWLLPVGGLLITLFVGWRMDKKIVENEVALFGPDGKTTFTYKMFRFFLKFTAPIAIIAVILAVIFGKDFS
jgi:NSS family neurotransmitter:Na+ symporter